ncbi:Uncharacterised protein [Bordetella pertussis]|nr:Uncharacterised protein [Bordetella pertussis]CFW45311.1 Uncharacterised protein [Bordetella pertussis]
MPDQTASPENNSVPSGVARKAQTYVSARRTVADGPAKRARLRGPVAAMPDYFSRSLTPSRSSSSSFSVKSRRSREKASISRSLIILYSPFSVTTGKP